MSLVVLLQTSCLIAFAILLCAAAWQDLRTLLIADGISIAIIAVFAVWALTGLCVGGLSLSDVVWSVACAAALFAVGAAAFAVGGIGGGDVKLLAAASLFAGPSLLLDFGLVTALAGGLLGVAVLAGAPLGAAPLGAMAGAGEPSPSRWRRSLPYGPAIAVGGLWVALFRVLG